MTAAFTYHKRFQTFFYHLKLVLVHRTDLAHAKGNVTLCNKLLIILIKDFFRRLVLQIASCLKHFLCKFLYGNICDQRKSSCCHFILKSTGRRTEHQSVRNNGRAEKSCDFRRNLQFLFSIDLIHNRSRTSYRLIPEADRLHCLKRTQLMMVDNFKDLRFFNIINSLILFIMIDQNHLFLMHIKKITARDRTHTFSLFVNYRECPVTMLDHHILNIICKILCVEGYQIFCFHDISHRNTLVDQS